MKSEFADPIQCTFFLSSQECEKICNAVFSLKSLWRQRHSSEPYFTLGAASYLDAIETAEKYFLEAAQLNPHLWEAFTWIYEKLATHFAHKLTRAVEYDPQLALPGFHVYLFSKLFETPIASIHYDLQHGLVGLAKFGEEISGIFSFTLVLGLPIHGGGLNWWNIPRQRFTALSTEEKSTYLLNHQQFLSYKIGFLYTHSGKILHQTAPGINLQPQDYRITLQGHAFLRNDTWILYW
jgi:hypothetical protein